MPSLTPELYDLIVKIVEDKIKDIKVTREEFDKLRRTIDERISKLEEALIRLAEAQRRTEERVEQLAQAQKRTEERLNALAEAQKKTEDALSRLMAEVEKLARGLNALRIEVGRLSETIGFGLEDIARVVVPGWLHRHLGVEVDELRREFFKVDSKEIEVNLYGEGTLHGEKVIIIGEVKSRIYKEDVEKFYNQIYAPITGKIEKKTIGLLFGYLIHPTARKRAEELGLHTIASYER